MSRELEKQLEKDRKRHRNTAETALPEWATAEVKPDKKKKKGDKKKKQGQSAKKAAN